MKIGISTDDWCNVGNAFFQMGLLSFLRKSFPKHEYLELASFSQEILVSKTPDLRNNIFRVSGNEDVDLVILVGPILKQLIMPEKSIAQIVERYLARGKKYAILSASASEMSDEDVLKAADFLNAHPPVAFATRDTYTYHRFKPYVPFCYDGICGAFLVPFIDGVADIINETKFFISSFYKQPEPIFGLANGEPVTISSITLSSRKNVFPIPLKFARHFEWLSKTYPAKLGDHAIVRIHQGFNPAMKWFNYAKPNSFSSYNPKCYLSLYKACDFVLSDRIHACAAALAFGRPARLLDDNDRIGIFSRMGFVKDDNGVIMPIERSRYMSNIETYRQYLSQIFQ